MAELLWPLACLCFLFLTAFGAYEPHFVKQLPGQPVVGFKQYAGQVKLEGVLPDKTFFYWFFEANHNESLSLPLVLWLSGGPGCSSVGAGALSELGPFRTNDAGTGLALNNFAWNKAANMIFLESPYGVGFSYSENASLDGLNDAQTAADSLLFLLQWLSMFPEYLENDFYITGESYAGHYVPMLASHILKHNQNPGQPTGINFKGFAIGNPWTAESYEDPGNLEFLYTHSIIPSRVYDAARRNCYSSSRHATACGRAQQMVNELTLDIDMYNIYAQNCNDKSSKRKKGRKFHHKELLRGAYDPCLDSLTPYMNLESVQASLHVESGPVAWSECSDVVNGGYSERDIESSVLDLYPQFFNASLRVWIYSGDVDGVVSTISTKGWLEKLKLNVSRSWYAWNYNDQVGGWTEVYKELTFVTVRGSGHMVPTDKPGPAFAVFEHFLKGGKLPSF